VDLRALKLKLAIRWRRATNALIGFIGVRVLRVAHFVPLGVMSNAAGALLRTVGPLLREHRIGRTQLAAAFPEKSPDEIERILRGAWDNLGRAVAEFAHIDQLWDYDKLQGAGRIMRSDDSEKIAIRLRDDGKPALVFAAHVGNWELPAIAAKMYGLDTTVLYRRPNLKAVADAVAQARAGCMGTLLPTTMDAPVKLADALKHGSHVAMLVDQWYGPGVPVTFFGRKTLANQTIARLARHFECPIHGIRSVRHPDGRLQVLVTEAIEPKRDAEGKIDVDGTMQVITGVVEGWVREHPEQWLWLHRRWREDSSEAAD
jgi:Kdo2-lipid IVA lauroyltransferase/acyltransferase